MLFTVLSVPVYDDEHKTQVFLKRLTDNLQTNGEVLLVTIERVDDLKDHETHELVGKKVTNILLKFDVTEKGEVIILEFMC